MGPIDDIRLGRLLSVHPVDNRKRWIHGGVALLVAVGGGALMALLIAAPSDASAYGKALGFALIPIAGASPIAVVQLARAVKGGFGAESFELHEFGLAHRSWGARRVWTWQEVAVVRLRQGGAFAQGTFWARLGWNRQCVLRFSDGARVRIDGLAEGAPELAARIVERVDPNVLAAPNPNRSRVVLMLLLPVAMIACAVAMVLMFRYINENDQKTIETGSGYYETVSGISDSLAAGLAVIGIICVVGFITAAVGLAYVVTAWFKDR